MKKLASILLALSITLPAMATNLSCQSSDYGVVLTQDTDGQFNANVTVKGIPSETEEVVVEEASITYMFANASIRIDDKSGFIKIMTIRKSPKRYIGKLEFNSWTQAVICTIK